MDRTQGWQVISYFCRNTSKQLMFVSVIRVASNTMGLKPSDLIRLRYSFGIMLLESVLMLKSPSIKHLRLDK